MTDLDDGYRVVEVDFARKSLFDNTQSLGMPVNLRNLIVNTKPAFAGPPCIPLVFYLSPSTASLGSLWLECSPKKFRYFIKTIKANIKIFYL